MSVTLVFFGVTASIFCWSSWMQARVHIARSSRWMYQSRSSLNPKLASRTIAKTFFTSACCSWCNESACFSFRPDCLHMAVPEVIARSRAERPAALSRVALPPRRSWQTPPPPRQLRTQPERSSGNSAWHSPIRGLGPIAFNSPWIALPCRSTPYENGEGLSSFAIPGNNRGELAVFP